MLDQKIQVIRQNSEKSITFRFLSNHHSMITDHDRKLYIEVEMNQTHHVIFRNVCLYSKICSLL